MLKLRPKRRFSVLPLVAITTMMSWSTTFAQNYPAKPLRIVTSEAGGGVDFVSRLVAQGIAGALGQPVVVDNRPSAVTGDAVAKAAPDGYTVLLNGNSIWMSSLLQQISYDPVRDLAPVTLATRSPNILVVHPSLPVKSVKELIALAKARPGELNYGSAGAGGSPHLSAELFKSMARVDIVRVPYRGNGPVLNAVIAGQVQLTFASAGTMGPLLKSGRLRAIAVTSLQPSALFPELPTVAAAALPGYESTSSYGIFAPARTPAAVINRLNQEIVQFISTAEAKQRLLMTGVESVGSSAEQLAATVNSELQVWGKVIKDAGIRAE